MQCIILSFTPTVNSPLSKAFANVTEVTNSSPSVLGSRGPMGSALLSLRWGAMVLSDYHFTVSLHFVLFCFLGLSLVLLLFTFPTLWVRVCCLTESSALFL